MGWGGASIQPLPMQGPAGAKISMDWYQIGLIGDEVGHETLRSTRARDQEVGQGVY